jgi:hypothetical protein
MKHFFVRIKKRVENMVMPFVNSKDLRTELQRIATNSSANYIRANMRTVQSVADRLSVHDNAINCVLIREGLCLEFGVYSGFTINYIASKRDWIVDGFDSFEGLPENWRDRFGKNCFSTDSQPKVKHNVHLHKGFFAQSIPEFLNVNDRANLPIAYMHIDCDLYSSTKTIFNLLGHKIVSGTVIVFDEYFNYDGWEHGEYLAFQEFVNSESIKYEYITYNHKHEQVAVMIK